MNYEQTLEYIHKIPKFNRVLGNDLLRVLLDKMGNPQLRLKFIHVGGTNGKGSVCTMIAEVLKQAGYKVGLFTSPYLIRFNERIRINGSPISDDDLVDVVGYVKEISEKHDAAVSEFAFDTAVAFEYFKRSNCDFVVLEVGLGGRLDATNVINTPIVTCFTAIGLDHCQYLGDTIDDISKEKFGIIKPKTKVVLYPIQEQIVFENAKSVCQNVGSQLTVPDLSEITDINGRSFRYKSQTYTLNMTGEFQIYNAVTAIEVLSVLQEYGCEISGKDIQNGLKHAKIRGRFEYINDKLVVDGAHNPPAVNALINTLKDTGKHIYFLTAVMQDKDYNKIAELISDFAICNKSHVVTCEVNMPRCLDACSLAKVYQSHGVHAQAFKESSAAFEYICKLSKDDPSALICVCGSLYLAGELMRAKN